MTEPKYPSKAAFEADSTSAVATKKHKHAMMAWLLKNEPDTAMYYAKNLRFAKNRPVLIRQLYYWYPEWTTQQLGADAVEAAYAALGAA